MEKDKAIEIAEKNKRLGMEKRRARAGLTAAERGILSSAVADKLRRLNVYRAAENVLSYVSFGEELQTEGFIRMAFADGKKIFCPRVEGKHMEFYRIFSMEELKPGCMGIPEPDGNTEIYRAAANSIAVVPGSAFDRAGHRIGYGGGYYDRWLAGFLAGQRPYCAGVCFSCQLTEEIQPLPHDITMDLVLFA